MAYLFGAGGGSKPKSGDVKILSQNNTKIGLDKWGHYTLYVYNIGNIIKAEEVKGQHLIERNKAEDR